MHWSELKGERFLEVSLLCTTHLVPLRAGGCSRREEVDTMGVKLSPELGLGFVTYQLHSLCGSQFNHLQNDTLEMDDVLVPSSGDRLSSLSGPKEC